MKIDGACHCGAITYAAEIDPSGVRLCHCTDCQALSGSAFRVTVAAADGRFALLSGSRRSTSDGGKRGQARACLLPDCGTPSTPPRPATARRNTASASAIRQRAELRRPGNTGAARRWTGDGSAGDPAVREAMTARARERVFGARASRAWVRLPIATRGSARPSGPRTARRPGTPAQPGPRAAKAGRPVSASSPSRTVPVSAPANPPIASSRVVLPAPLGPTRPVTLPGRPSRPARSRAVTPPKRHGHALGGQVGAGRAGGCGGQRGRVVRDAAARRSRFWCTITVQHQAGAEGSWRVCR